MLAIPFRKHVKEKKDIALLLVYFVVMMKASISSSSCMHVMSVWLPVNMCSWDQQFTYLVPNIISSLIRVQLM